MPKPGTPAIQTQTAGSWIELIEMLYADAWDAGIRRFRSPYVFRGVGSAKVDLQTSLQRLGAGHGDVARLEGHLLRNFRKYAHSDAHGPSIWNAMALAQHHGLHTRLLDWTFSPFVAMHFVTERLPLYDVDGAIWCVSHRETNKKLPAVLKRALANAGSDVFTAEMLDQVAGTLRALDRLAREPFVVFLEPPTIDIRIANQFALFSLLSSPSYSLDAWLAHNPAAAKKIIVPAKLKWEIRDKLDQAGVTERILYPGLDGLTRWLARYYASSEVLPANSSDTTTSAQPDSKRSKKRAGSRRPDVKPF